MDGWARGVVRAGRGAVSSGGAAVAGASVCAGLLAPLAREIGRCPVLGSRIRRLRSRQTSIWLALHRLHAAFLSVA